MSELTIGNVNVVIKEYRGQRVVTLKDIDTVHQRPDGTARKRFNDNKKHFIEGEDYFKIQPSEIRTVGIKSPNGGTVVTESGYLMLVKSFTDDLSWNVQRELVNTYFRVKQERTPEYEQLKLEDKPYNYFDKFYKGQPVISIDDFEFFTGVTRYRAYGMLMRRGKPGTDYFHLDGSALAEFKEENPNFPKAAVRWFIVITKAGFEKLIGLVGYTAESPKIFIEEKKPVVASKPTVDDYITTLNVIRSIRDDAAEFMKKDIEKGETFMIDSYAKDIEACKLIMKLLGMNVVASCT